MKSGFISFPKNPVLRLDYNENGFLQVALGNTPSPPGGSQNKQT